MTRPRVPFVVGIVLLVSLVLGLVAERLVRVWVQPEVRAAWMLRGGRRAEAETLLYRALERGPITTERVLAFLQCHGSHGVPHAAPKGAPDDDDEDGRTLGRPMLSKGDEETQAISERDVDALLARPDVPKDTALIARFVRELGEDDETDVVLRTELMKLADAEPPAPWANHLLGREAQLDGKLPLAASRYLREGISFAEHAGDVDLGLTIVREYDGPEGVRRALEDPRVAARASAYLKLKHAVDLRRWKDAARWSLRGAYQWPALSALVITAFAALSWMAFLARVGAAGERPAVRIPLYLTAFSLGVLSIWPTTFLIVAQESGLHLTPRGNPLQDERNLFVLGVGFREEMSKLLLFAPLLFILRRLDNTPRGDGTVRLRPGKVPSFPVSVDVVVCGALVGLGFAAEENLAYLEHGDLATGMARFLTANFLHMAMTALTANALYDFTRAPEAHSFEFTTTLFTVILLHGAYDFFLTSHAFGSLSLFAMGVFFVLTRKFINVLSSARKRAGRGMPPFQLFTLGLGIVSGASFVFSCAMVGPAAAATSMLGGLLGVAIVLFMFASELRRL